jgi:hypothetical protein
MKIAIIIGGWYFPKHLYENVIQVTPPQDTTLDFFTVSHRNPELMDIKSEMLPRIKDNNKYDLELFNDIITYSELEKLGYKVNETENVIGDYYFFNQWTELYNYKEYDYIIFMHDDNYLLPSFKDILIDIFNKEIEFYKKQNSWVPVPSTDFDYIANSAVGSRNTARGSFSIWSKKLLDEMGGLFPMDNVTFKRNGLINTPKNHMDLDWNIVGTNFQNFIQDNNFMDTTFRLSPYYRVSKYLIEGERGLISNTTVSLNMFDGLKKYT